MAHRPGRKRSCEPEGPRSSDCLDAGRGHSALWITEAHAASRDGRDESSKSLACRGRGEGGRSRRSTRDTPVRVVRKRRLLRWPRAIGAGRGPVEHQPPTRPGRDRVGRASQHARGALSERRTRSPYPHRRVSTAVRGRVRQRLRDQSGRASRHGDLGLSRRGGTPTHGGALESRTLVDRHGQCLVAVVSGVPARISGLMPLVEIVSPSGR